VLIPVPETRTAYVQELHLPVYHAICLMVEHEFFKK
jgi:D-sedoheptulose 7-phosphate isomerase